MASYLQIENISKSYGHKVLFENIGFNINEGDKIALIAPNGTGKTSLMKILAGKDKSDSGGKIMFLKDIRIAFLEQDYPFDPQKTIFQQIMSSSTEFTRGLDQEHLWEYERRVVKFLSNFNLPDPDQLMKELSGGEVKRVALTQMLASEAEFFIMDEPTNHLDIASREWVEAAIEEFEGVLIFVSHDRYFIEKFAERIWVLEEGTIKDYPFGYAKYRSVLEHEAMAKPTPVLEVKPKKEKVKGGTKELDKLVRRLEREIEKQEAAIAEIDQKIEESGADYETLTRLYEEKETAEAQLLDFMEQWEAAQS